MSLFFTKSFFMDFIPIFYCDRLHLEMGDLKQIELQRLKTEERKAEDKKRK